MKKYFLSKSSADKLGLFFSFRQRLHDFPLSLEKKNSNRFTQPHIKIKAASKNLVNINKYYRVYD